MAVEMDHEERCELLAREERTDDEGSERSGPAAESPPWEKTSAGRQARLRRWRWCSSHPRSFGRLFYVCLAASVVTVVAIAVTLVQRPQQSSPAPAPAAAHDEVAPRPGHRKPAFTGAFARFPRLSELPERQRRMTVVGAWNGDSFPAYLRHFFYTIQLNADVLDLVMINRRRAGDSGCLDFEKAGVDIRWGGNVRVHCMDNDEWQRRHVDFMCSAQYGWDCNATEYEQVTAEYQTREDAKNYNWRLWRGYVFRDLFLKPDQPFWAWMDHDVFVGNFARYPFNVLSQLSLLTQSYTTPEWLYMAGQLTAFNLDDEALGTAWKKFPPMQSAAHFTKYTKGKMPSSSEERYWSYGYLRSTDNLPGTDLSYAIVPDLLGEDYYDGRWGLEHAQETYLISGKDILLASASFSRKEIEELFRVERHAPVDDLGGVGWTGGIDGSSQLLGHAGLNSSEAKVLAVEEAADPGVAVHEGIVEDVPIKTNCGKRPKWKQCVDRNPLALSDTPIMRSTLVRFKEHEKGHLLRRLERDQRPRGFERKLLKHHSRMKQLPWFEFPPFEIKEDMVLRHNFDFIEVFRMGPTRNETLFFRKKDEKSIG